MSDAGVILYLQALRLDEERFSYDVCFVFKVGKAGKKATLFQREFNQDELFEHHLADCIDRMRRAQLNVLVYRSQTEKEIFVLAGASEALLKHEAYHSNYELRLDPAVLYQQGRSVGLRLARV